MLFLSRFFVRSFRLFGRRVHYFEGFACDDGAERRCRGSLRHGIILRRRCLRHDRAQNSPMPAEIAPVDGSPRDENGQSFPRTTTGMEPDSTRLDLTPSRLGSTRLIPSSLFSLPLAHPSAEPSFPRADPTRPPLQFGLSHKLAAIHLALVLKRESRLVGRYEIKSPLSPPHSPSLDGISSSFFLPARFQRAH